LSGKDSPWEFFSSEQIATIGNCPQANVEAVWPHVAWAMDADGMWDIPTVMVTIATAAIETAHTFLPVREAFWLSEEWRKANLRYYPWYGRGIVQTTWLSNYEGVRDRTGIDVVSNPDLLLEPSPAAWALTDYFRHHATPDMQALAFKAWSETGDWSPTRVYVNGGLNGWDEYASIIDALGAAIDARPAPPPPPATDPCAPIRQAVAAALKYKTLPRAARKILESVSGTS
jgi:hypothetical protein